MTPGNLIIVLIGVLAASVTYAVVMGAIVYVLETNFRKGKTDERADSGIGDRAGGNRGVHLGEVGADVPAGSSSSTNTTFRTPPVDAAHARVVAASVVHRRSDQQRKDKAATHPV